MPPIRAVTVYCSSSRDVAAAYFGAAQALGHDIAAAGWALVYGGNNLGLMDAVAGEARAAGGRVVGVTPRLMADKGIADRLCDELIVTETMRERKALLESRGDALVALPGGMGTFEELFEVLVGRLLGYHDKPIVLVNIAGYYQPLLDMIEHGMAQHFIKPKARRAYFVAQTVDEAVAYLQACEAGKGDEGPTTREPSARE